MSDKNELIEAMRNGKTDKAKTLIKTGANVNARDEFGNTALMPAAWNGHTEIVELLIKAGADLEAKSTIGCAALDYAKYRGNQDIIKLLEEQNNNDTLEDKAREVLGEKFKWKTIIEEE